MNNTYNNTLFDTDFTKEFESFSDKFTNQVNKITHTIEYSEKSKSKQAIFCGSFDPFTNGHLSIVKKASQIFDTVYIVLAVNYNKNRTTNKLSMIDGIKNTLIKEDITNCIVDYTYDLVAKYCKEKNIKYFIRGLRNNMDYNYEENIAEVNELLNDELEYVYFRADNKAISSSMIRELMSYNQSVSQWVPKDVLNCMEEDK